MPLSNQYLQTCILYVVGTVDAFNATHEIVHAPDEEIRRGRCQTPPGLNIYSATVENINTGGPTEYVSAVNWIRHVAPGDCSQTATDHRRAVDNHDQSCIVRCVNCKQTKISTSE